VSRLKNEKSKIHLTSNPLTPQPPVPSYKDLGPQEQARVDMANRAFRRYAELQYSLSHTRCCKLRLSYRGDYLFLWLSMSPLFLHSVIHPIPPCCATPCPLLRGHSRNNAGCHALLGAPQADRGQGSTVLCVWLPPCTGALHNLFQTVGHMPVHRVFCDVIVILSDCVSSAALEF
jgi:hypothetical protein